MTHPLRSLVIPVTTILALSACNSNASGPAPTLPTTAPGIAQVRAVHGSPDAGPVDIYVYSGTARPTAATISAATYPQITDYLSVPAGVYTVDVLAKGAASTATAVATEHVIVNASTKYSVVVGGKVAGGTLQFVNFVDPAEIAGQSALIVHHASPFVQSAIAPVGVGVYDAGAAAGAKPVSATDLFSFSLKNPSGPATSGAAPADGEFFLSPLPATLPSAVGFAAGAPSTPGSPLGSIAVFATPSQLAAGLANPTAAQKTLAADTAAAIPAGAHLSIFAIDSAAAAQLIGTLDP